MPRCGVDVTVKLGDGLERWSYFMRPSTLTTGGGRVPGTRAPFDHGVPHMIVVGELTLEIGSKVLRHLDAEGEHEESARPLD